jgi:hypothetical protein
MTEATRPTRYERVRAILDTAAGAPTAYRY